MARSAALHGLGRGVRVAGRHATALGDRPMVQRAERLIARYGAPVIVLSYLTVGVQSAIHIASGLLRMPGRRYVPAAVLGSALWATIYTTVGFAVVYAALGHVSWWWIVAALGALAVTALVTVVIRRRLGAR